MSIYIKNMEMPTVRDTLVLVKTNGTAIVYEDEAYVTTAVPVPTHGRLIDADAALRNGWTISRTYSASPTEMVCEVKTIDCLPTIIEAEEGE